MFPSSLLVMFLFLNNFYIAFVLQMFWSTYSFVITPLFWLQGFHSNLSLSYNSIIELNNCRPFSCRPQQFSNNFVLLQNYYYYYFVLLQNFGACRQCFWRCSQCLLNLKIQDIQFSIFFLDILYSHHGERKKLSKKLHLN